MQRLDTVNSHFKKETIIVCGVGTMGVSTCATLAERGYRVIGLERHTINNTKASHAGQSRLFRHSYHEHPDYVPLLRRAHVLWHELNKKAGKTIFHQTGGVYVNPPGCVSEEPAAKLHNLKHEVLTAAELKKRFPVFDVPEDWTALYEEAAGLICPEWAIPAYEKIARDKGAELHENVKVVDWSVTDNKVTVRCADG